ncbi:transposase [Nitrospira defluvii]|nr:transposase [Nitrospira defluvii]
MARYKPYSYNQSKLIPVYFADQILPSTFEYALNYIVDNELDLSIFLDRYQNDETGAPAFDPAIFLKIVLFAYSHGITSSRKTKPVVETTSSLKPSLPTPYRTSPPSLTSSPPWIKKSPRCFGTYFLSAMKWA